MRRPKSAIFMSVPFNYGTKEEAIKLKNRIKECFTNGDDVAVKKGAKSYFDSGPSLLNSTACTYTTVQA